MVLVSTECHGVAAVGGESTSFVFRCERSACFTRKSWSFWILFTLGSGIAPPLSFFSHSTPRFDFVAI